MARSGKYGSVLVDGSALEVINWTLDGKAEVFKYGLGGFKRAVVGVLDCSGTFEALGTPPAPGSQVTLVLKEGGTEGRTFTGNAVIKNVSTSVNIDTGDLVRYRVDFEGDGEWTIS